MTDGADALPPRPGGAPRWAALLLLLLAASTVASFAILRERADPAARHARVEVMGLRLADEDGRTAVIPRRSALPLAPGARLVLGAGDLRFSSLRLGAARAGTAADLVLSLPTDQGDLTLLVTPDEPFALRVERAGSPRADVVAAAVLASPHGFVLDLRLGRDGLAVRLDDTPVLTVPDVHPVSGAVIVAARRADMLIHDPSYRCERPDGSPVVLAPSLDELPAPHTAPRLLSRVLVGLALAALLALLLYTLAPPPVRPAALRLGLCMALAFPAPALILALWTDVPHLGAVSALLLVAGLFVATCGAGPLGRKASRSSRSLRLSRPARASAAQHPLATPLAPDFTPTSTLGPAAALPAHSAASVPSRAGLVGLLVLALVGLHEVDVRGRSLFVLASAERAAMDALEQDPPPAPAMPAWPFVLDGASAVTLPGPFRDLDLHVRCDLSADAVLGVRLRAPDAREPRGLLLLVPAPGGAARPGIVEEDVARFVPVSAPGPALRETDDVQLEIELRGRTVSAFVRRPDGARRLLARAESLRFPAGDVVLLSQGGTVVLRECVLQPRASEDVGFGHPLGRLLRLSLAPPLLAWLALFLAARFAGGTRADAAALGAALALLVAPVAVRLLGQDDGALDVQALAVAAAVATLLVAWHQLVQGTAGAWWRLTVVLLAPLVLWPAWQVSTPRPRADDGRELNALDWADAGRPSAITAVGAHRAHPLLRRWNTQLGQHLFRGRRISSVPADGTVRVFVLGGSSAWGYGLPMAAGVDVAAVLQERLAADGPIEVLNAAYSAATGTRLLALLEERLLALRPHVIVVDLGYNDSFALTQADEAAWAARPWVDERSLLSLARHLRLDADKARMNRLLDAFARRGPPTRPLWDEVARPGESSPPERFGAVLHRFADVCEAAGVRLVFVREPVSPERPRLWIDEFHRAMGDVGAQRGIPVVDPASMLASRAADGPVFMDEVHLTPRGHAALADAIVPVLREVVAACR